MKNIKLTIEFDGTNYCGWQRQLNAISVEEQVEVAIKKIVNEDIKLIGSSRTDSGVHARGMAANFLTLTRISPEKLPAAINSKLPLDIAILHAEEVPEDFHARYSSIGKRYSYTIFNRKTPPALMRNYVAHCVYDLDFNLMVKASKALVGTHDFSAFKSTGGSVKTSVRTVRLLELDKRDNIIIMNIEADGFLYNMVRIVAGTLIDIGRGRIPAESISEIIEGCNRDKAGHTAKASGLCLEKVYY